MLHDGIVKTVNKYFSNLYSLLGAKSQTSEIKVTIDFCSNFVRWIFIIWKLKYWNKKGGAHAHYEAVRHWKSPILALFNACDKLWWSVDQGSGISQTKQSRIDMEEKRWKSLRGLTIVYHQFFVYWFTHDRVSRNLKQKLP